MPYFFLHITEGDDFLETSSFWHFISLSTFFWLHRIYVVITGKVFGDYRSTKTIYHARFYHIRTINSVARWHVFPSHTEPGYFNALNLSVGCPFESLLIFPLPGSVNCFFSNFCFVLLVCPLNSMIQKRERIWKTLKYWNPLLTFSIKVHVYCPDFQCFLFWGKMSPYKSPPNMNFNQTFTAKGILWKQIN